MTKHSFTVLASESFEKTLRELGLDNRKAELPDPEILGRDAALVAAAGLVWTEHLGPLLDAKFVQSFLDVTSRQAVSDLRRRDRLLGLRHEDGHVAFPLFQFDRRGRPFRVLPEILGILRGSDVSDWTIASWFVTPQALLDDQAPAEWLRNHGSLDRLRHAAKRSAARLGQ